MQSLQLRDASFGHLPLVVVGAVSVTGAWLLFALQVNTQVLQAVVGLVAVHVVDALVRTQRSAQVLRHDPPMLGYPFSALRLHQTKQRQVSIIDASRANDDVSAARDGSSSDQRAPCPSVITKAGLFLAACSALAREIRPLQLLPQRRAGIPPERAAVFARDRRRERASLVDPQDSALRTDRWMWLQWSVVDGARHGLSSGVKQ